MSWKTVFIFLAITLVLACSARKEQETPPAQEEATRVTKAPAMPHQFDPSQYKTTESGLKYVIFHEGTGPKVKVGDRVFVHYTGWLLNGKKFDSSYDRHVPISFVLGNREVIQGWEEGIALLRVGDKAQFIIPPHLAYGSQQVGPIPPNSTLVFEVEVVRVGL